MAYWLLFITIIIIALWGCSNNKKKVAQSLWLIWLCITLFQGLRWNTGADWAQYEYTFRTSTWNNIFTYQRGLQDRYMEPGYMFINILIKTIFKYYTFFLLITCGFINYVFKVLSKKYIPLRYQTLAFAMLIVCSVIFPVRQGLACAVFFYFGLPYIHSRNFKKFLLVIVLCYTIHYSCLVLIVFYWINKPLNTYILLAIYMCSSIIAEVLPSVFDIVNKLPFIQGTSYSNLVESVMEQQLAAEEKVGLNNIYTITIASFFMLIFGYVRDKSKKTDKNEYIKLSILLNLFFIASLGIQLAQMPTLRDCSRFGYWGGIGLPLLLIYSSHFFIKRHLKLYIPIIIFIVLFYFYKGASIFQGKYVDLYIPYYSIFENSKPRDVWYY
ncbi:EpsG family protein [uncultured Phocaeicola sp.]|uniref:EpsG family protein n=1 Tax=uncultured Phocaeicola sp. TaxID=990718 RepID=UPI0025DC9CA6|nr:EpsG family protein [uncultured Phocaeicola sp.]